MARTTVRTTFSLDPDTVSALDRLAAKWQVPKSEALRRIVGAAAAVEEVDWASDALAALDELQAKLQLTEEKADAWIREVRAAREASRP
jgi:predicted transcriptional regulator